MRAIAVLTTAGTEEQAATLARELVGRRQAACVNILPGVRSVYRFKGKVCEDDEYLLVIKTRGEQYEAVAATLRELHGYELPEVIAFEVAEGDAAYLDWIAASVGEQEPASE